MANESISQLNPAESIAPGDLFPITQGSTGPGTGTTVKAQASLIRPSGRILVQWTGGAVVVNGVGYFCLQAPYAGQIVGVSALCPTGSFTLEVQLAGSPVGGLSAIAVSGALTETDATGTNEFTIGQTLGFTVSGATSSPTNAAIELLVNWT